MIPQEFEADVGEDSQNCHNDKSEEHLAHGQHCRFVDHLLSSTFVHKFKHFVGLYLSVTAGDGPLKLLIIKLLLAVANHGHMRLGDDDVGCCVEPELLEDLLVFLGVSDGGEEGRVRWGVDCAVALVEVDHVFELREELAACWRRYVQRRCDRAVKKTTRS